MKISNLSSQEDIFVNLWSQSITNIKKVSCKQLCALVFLLISPIFAFADSLTVKADRNQIEMGDIITLYITADFQTAGEQPNLEILQDQFEVLGKQQSNRIEVINGRFSSNSSWQVTLLAKQTGELIVPPMKIGSIESQPYKISVSPAQPKSAQNASNYFIESSLNKDQVYIQEEVLYSLKLNFIGNFNGTVRPPLFEDALSATIKDQSVYGKQINGQQYTVYEWLYAIYPQQSGELKIDGPVFSGIHILRGRQKGVQEKAKSHHISVLPEPSSFSTQPDTTWLPAEFVQLSDSWESLPNTIHVGDSLTRTLTLDAVGLKASQLPKLGTENQAGFKIYADQPQTEEAVIQSGVRSQVQIKQAIVPTQAGTLTLPEQQITWWNTKTKQVEISTIPERSFNILPAPANAYSVPVANESTDAINKDLATDPAVALPLNVPRETNTTWLIITVLLGLAWFITLWLWRRQSQQFKARIQALEAALKESNSEPENSDQRGAETTIAQNTEDSAEDKANVEPLILESQSIAKRADIKLCEALGSLSPNEFYHELRQQLTEQFAIHSFIEIDHQPLKLAIDELEKHLFHQIELKESTLESICDELTIFAEIRNQNKSEFEQKKESKLASLYHQ